MTAMIDLLLPASPGLLLAIGGVIAAALPSLAARPFAVALPVVLLAYAYGLPEGAHASLTFLGAELELLRVDPLARVFGMIFLIAAALANLYALGDSVGRLQRGAAMVYAGSAVAAVFAGDMISLFVFIEISVISSVFLIWARGTERSYRAGMRYLIIQIGSGVILLAGVMVHYAETGSVAFGHLGLEAPGGALILFALGIKCAFPFLHNWLQDAYPEATVSGTVVLSAFTTKLAIYCLARSFAGTEMLIWIGAAMTAFPIFYAVIENDLRRVLAYSLNNQLGFMVVGIGIGTELALNGTAAHAFCHILYKALLFMSMGAVLLRAGTVNGSELGGLYRTMPWTMAFCVVGAASISAFPLFSGFVSKSMILSAAGYEGLWFVWLTLLFASAGVFHHSGIKIPYFAFFAHDSGLRPKEAPLPMLIAMGITAALCVGIGVFPSALYALLPYPVDYHPYGVAHVVNQLQLLMFSALAFTVLMLTRLYPPELRSTNLDVDWVYRWFLPKVLREIGQTVDRIYQGLLGAGQAIVGAIVAVARRLGDPRGALGGSTTLSDAVTLAILLLMAGILVAYAAT